MTRSRRFFAILSVPVIAFASFGVARGAEQQDRSANAKHVYGEWRIRVKPDKGEEYNTLIQQRGLPLFREAGGRMVGWWKTLAGNLYEQTTIWEYDDMSAYERAVERLGHDQRFAEFAARRDPLLAGEESRFLKLADGAERPDLPDRFEVRDPRNPSSGSVEARSISQLYDDARAVDPQVARFPSRRALDGRNRPMESDHVPVPI